MSFYSKQTRRYILMFALAVLAAEIMQLFARQMRYAATFIYCGILIAWILTVQKRVIQ